MEANLSMDQAFIERLRSIVEENLENEHFSVSDLAREVGMSRSQIHRKLQEINDQSTTQFIREIRLEHAMEMLRNRVATVSEIAYRVGFASPTYFSKCFHEYYGYPPGEAVERGEEESGQSRQENVEGAQSFTVPGRYKQLLYPVGFLILILLLASSFFYYQNSNENPDEVTQSIAVLPLDNLTGDPDQAFFVDGLHDALIGELGQLSRLRVVSRTSTLQFRNPESNIQEIAGRLGVNNILEGSVYRAEDSVRIQVQLIQVDPEERHIWANSYDRDTRNVLGMLSDVTREIARNVQVSLTPEEDSLLANRRSVNPEAYKAYLRGQYHLNSYTPEGYEKGIGYLLEAVRIDPADPLPWARLALGYNTAGHGIAPPDDAFDKAQAAAEKALALDPTLGEVHLAQALVNLYQEWDWQAADRRFEQAIRYDPNIAETHAHNAWFIMLKGGTKQEVIAEEQLAVDLDPFTPLYPTYLGFIYWWAGEYDEAIEAARESLTLDPDFAYAYYVLGNALVAKGLFEEAIEAHRKASELNPTWEFALAHTFAKSGRIEEALNMAGEMAADPTPIETWGLAEIYTTLGEYDTAFQWLEKCKKMRFSWYPWINWHVYYQPLKDDPRFEELLVELDLPNHPSLASGF